MRTARLRTVHPLLLAGWAAAATGAVLCVIGWYGVSGERFAERQVPYLASCTVPGAALLIAGAVLLVGGRHQLAAARVEELYRLLVTAGAGAGDATPSRELAAEPLATSEELRTIPGGTLWHRADCPLVAGKPEAEVVAAGAAALAGGVLSPCPVCEPDAGPGDGPRHASGTATKDGPGAGASASES
ncbi:hypothetical protein [Streptomyces apocyni]|uniref:hypothetical protein n=1 Tax=Streptomyces apocyni TaxID=2654677 RepID=UPI0012EA633A|nr:hypothetical protein [Streptomyces apocyni]